MANIQFNKPITFSSLQQVIPCYTRLFTLVCSFRLNISPVIILHCMCVERFSLLWIVYLQLRTTLMFSVKNRQRSATSRHQQSWVYTMMSQVRKQSFLFFLTDIEFIKLEFFFQAVRILYTEGL